MTLEHVREPHRNLLAHSQVAGEALEAYATNDRARWILDWPGQLVLNCSQVGVALQCV